MALELLTLNLAPTPQLTRNEKLEGRDYLVVPMVMLVEGVLNGSNGPLYYPGDEIKRHPSSWNHKPIVVDHPTQNGQGISACDPVVIETRKVGLIMNTRFAQGPNRLPSEAWLDMEKLYRVDPDLHARILNNEKIEVSTGVFTKNESQEGEFNGKPYVGIARNYAPDHLALLPSTKGACSVEDGAGLLQNQEKPNPIDPLSRNEQSFDRIYQQLAATLPDDPTSPSFIVDVYKDFFVYQKRDNLYQKDYEVDGEKVKPVGSPKEVVRVTEYRTVSGEFVGNASALDPTPKESKMTKNELVEALVKNAASGFAEADRKELENLSESLLQKLVDNSENQEKVDPNGPTEEEKEAAAKKGAAEVTSEPAKEEPKKEAAVANSEVSVEECLNAMPPAIRELITDSLAANSRHRNTLIDSLANNESVKTFWSREDLAGKPTAELEKLDQAFSQKAATTNNSQGNLLRNYYGQTAGLIDNAQGQPAKETPLGMPTLNFSKTN